MGKWIELRTEDRKAVICKLLKRFGPMDIRQIAGKMNKAKLGGLIDWTPTELFVPLRQLREEGRIYVLLERIGKNAKVYAFNELFNGPGAA